MNISINSRIEKQLTISETDMINGGDVIILIAYAIKDDNGVFTFPDTQIYNKEVYERNKEIYNAQILAFRNDCENMTEDKGSILADEISSLKEDNEMIMMAISELADLILAEEETPNEEETPLEEGKELEEGENID